MESESLIFTGLEIPRDYDTGMEVNTVDKSEFRKAISPVYEKYSAQYGDLLNKIEKAKEE